MVPSVWGQVCGEAHHAPKGRHSIEDKSLICSFRWTSERTRMLLNSQVAAAPSCNGFMTFDVLICSIGSTRSPTFTSFSFSHIFRYSPDCDDVLTPYSILFLRLTRIRFTHHDHLPLYRPRLDRTLRPVATMIRVWCGDNSLITTNGGRWTAPRPPKGPTDNRLYRLAQIRSAVETSLLTHNSFCSMRQRMSAIFSSFSPLPHFSTPGSRRSSVNLFKNFLLSFVSAVSSVLSGLFKNHTAVCREVWHWLHASRVQQYPLVLLCKIDSSWRRPRYHDQILVTVVIPEKSRRILRFFHHTVSSLFQS